MSDLVTRLRLVDMEFMRTGSAELQRRMWEAADELVALRARLDSLLQAAQGARAALGNAKSLFCNQDYINALLARLDTAIQQTKGDGQPLERKE